MTTSTLNRQYDPRNPSKLITIQELVWLYEEQIKLSMLKSKDSTRLVACLLGIYLAEEVLYYSTHTVYHNIGNKEEKKRIIGDIVNEITKRLGCEVYGCTAAILGEYL
jgi:hypothetical protein